MGVFPNENATARPFRDTHQQGKCSSRPAGLWLSGDQPCVRQRFQLSLDAADAGSNPSHYLTDEERPVRHVLFLLALRMKDSSSYIIAATTWSLTLRRLRPILWIVPALLYAMLGGATPSSYRQPAGTVVSLRCGVRAGDRAQQDLVHVWTLERSRQTRGPEQVASARRHRRRQGLQTGSQPLQPVRTQLQKLAVRNGRMPFSAQIRNSGRSPPLGGSSLT